MKLKRLEIMGFKSFADPFRIDFTHDISAIVGPNGCGKSNVADAIRWVLGNQSPKQLRAEKMESVIFTGSTKRKQLGMAEVILTFDNSSRRLDLEYDEVSVARKLFRTGDSEYSINGSRCRLMDITDLIVDKGLGSTGYWVLESKMVATILSNRPEDRRFLFDEAAGIVKYKIQRHRAELKLNSAANDLERLSDIIVEVESTCNGLKRQVSAFNRYKNVADSIKEINAALQLEEVSALTKKIEEKKKYLDEISSLVGKETIAYSTKSAVLNEAKVEYGRVQLKLDDAHKKCSDLDLKLASNDRELAITKERINSTQTRMAENTARIARERERLYRYNKDIEQLSDKKTTFLKKLISLEASKVENKLLVEQHRKKLTVIKASFIEAKENRTKFELEIRELQETYRKQIREEEAKFQKKASLKEAIEKINDRVTELQNLVNSSSEKLLIIQGKRKDLTNFVKSSMVKKGELLSEVSRISEIITTKKEKKAVLAEKIKRITKLIEDISEANTIASLVKPKQGMEKAIGAFFDSFGSAEPLNSLLPTTSTGGKRYALKVAKHTNEIPKRSISLSECVVFESKEAQYNELLKSILSYGLLAQSVEEARKWIKDGFVFTAVTLDGDIIRKNGFVRLGVSETNAGSLELLGIVEEAKTFYSLVEKEEEEFLSKLLNLKNELALIISAIETNQKKQQINENKIVSIETTLKSYNSELTVLKKELANNLFDLEKLNGSAIFSVSGSVEKKISNLQQQREKAFVSEEKITETFATEEKVLSDFLRIMDNIDFSLRENISKRTEIDSRIKMFEQEAESISDLLEELTRENEKFGAFVLELENNFVLLNSKRLELQKQRSFEEKIRNSYSQERNTLMESTALLEREVSVIREQLNKAKNLLTSLDTEVRALRDKLTSFPQAEKVAKNVYIDKTTEELETALLAKQVALDRIGPVNMLAVAEYNEASERLDYLVEQRNDLEHARASLAKAIVEINTEATERFDTTFEIVRTNFKDMFQRLFGGGEGDLIALESDDPLEGGIEIIARPKGKILNTVIALSAGEKALAAVALLFSLYLVKPSPFCVLDELDSPFDDSNTDKFIEILRDFSDKTQFIVITHNKRTMEGADVLFGITMAEEGVSTITSVSLENMELLR